MKSFEDIIINDIKNFFLRSWYWFLIIIIISFIIGILTEGDTNSGSYAILTASTLSVLVTMYETRKDSIEQMKKAEENTIIRTSYEPMKNALIDLDTYIRKNITENYRIGDAWTFSRIFESLLGEEFYKYLPQRIRNEVIENIKKIDVKYKRLEYMGYVYKESQWAASLSRDYDSLETIKNNLKERIGIEENDTDCGWGVFYFISRDGSDEFDLNIGNNSSNYDEITELIRNAITETDPEKVAIIQNHIMPFVIKNEQQVVNEILNPILIVINDFLETISIENIRDLILEDIKKFNQD